MSTKIPWCDESWNPVTGCTPIAEGCRNCFAKPMSLRLKAMGLHKYRNGFRVTCHPDELNAKVLRKRKPQRIFVCSMGDLLHERVNTQFIVRVLDVIAAHPQHTFIVLTKRIKRLLAFGVMSAWPTNMWLGVSVSTQREADELIPMLLQCPAAVRFVSLEPLIERVNLAPHLDGLSWVIVGCESGPKRRPFDEDWVRIPRDQCRKAGVPFFYKQGRDEKQANQDWADGRVHRAKVIHRPHLDGRRHEEYPR